MRLYFRLADESLDTPLPSRATEFSAGYDLFAPESVVIPPGQQLVVPLNVKWQPDWWTHTILAQSRRGGGPGGITNIGVGGFFAKIFDKSGPAVKQRFNTRAGVIDMDYPDPWGLVCVNEGHTDVVFVRHKAIAQFVLIPFLIADDLVNRDGTRTGGFGSTGQ